MFNYDYDYLRSCRSEQNVSFRLIASWQHPSQRRCRPIRLHPLLPFFTSRAYFDIGRQVAALPSLVSIFLVENFVTDVLYKTQCRNRGHPAVEPWHIFVVAIITAIKIHCAMHFSEIILHWPKACIRKIWKAISAVWMLLNSLQMDDG